MRKNKFFLERTFVKNIFFKHFLFKKKHKQIFQKRKENDHDKCSYYIPFG